jgi:hypothetical protein
MAMSPFSKIYIYMILIVRMCINNKLTIGTLYYIVGTYVNLDQVTRMLPPALDVCTEYGLEASN